MDFSLKPFPNTAGFISSKPNRGKDKAAANLARIWSTRNISLACIGEVESAHRALLGYGVRMDGNFSAPSSLLKRLSARLNG